MVDEPDEQVYHYVCTYHYIVAIISLWIRINSAFHFYYNAELDASLFDFGLLSFHSVLHHLQDIQSSKWGARLCSVHHPSASKTPLDMRCSLYSQSENYGDLGLRWSTGLLKNCRVSTCHIGDCLAYLSHYSVYIRNVIDNWLSPGYLFRRRFPENRKRLVRVGHKVKICHTSESYSMVGRASCWKWSAQLLGYWSKVECVVLLILCGKDISQIVLWANKYKWSVHSL